MKEYSSCKSAIQSCIENKSFAVAHLYNDERPMDMHIHDCYEIYYSISGGKQCLIDNRFYDIQPGDIFFINQYESHYLSQIDQAVHERIVLSIYPDFVKSISSQGGLHSGSQDPLFLQTEVGQRKLPGRGKPG